MMPGWFAGRDGLLAGMMAIAGMCVRSVVVLAAARMRVLHEFLCDPFRFREPSHIYMLSLTSQAPAQGFQ